MMLNLHCLVVRMGDHIENIFALNFHLSHLDHGNPRNNNVRQCKRRQDEEENYRNGHWIGKVDNFVHHILESLQEWVKVRLDHLEKI